MRARIDSTAEYKDLVHTTKQRLGRVRTNCKVMSSFFAQPISEGRVSFEGCDEGLLVFVNEGTFEDLYYYWDPQASLRVSSGTLPVVIDDLLRQDQTNEDRAAWYLDAGFAAYRTNICFALPLVQEGRPQFDENRLAASIERLGSEGFRFCTCTTIEQQKRVVELWDAGLELADVPYDHRDFVTRDDRSTVILATCNNEVAGAYWWQDERKGSRLGRHVVTNDAYKRRGIGSALIALCIQDAMEHGLAQLTTWISDNNVASIAMHKKLGFTATDRIAKQYVLAAQK